MFIDEVKGFAGGKWHVIVLWSTRNVKFFFY